MIVYAISVLIAWMYAFKQWQLWRDKKKQVQVTDMDAVARKAICRQCGYSLYQLPANLCPECGAEFDLNDEASFIKIGEYPYGRLVFFTLLFACLFFIGGTALSVINEMYYSDGYLDDLGWPFPIYTGRLVMGSVIHFDGIFFNLLCGLFFGLPCTIVLLLVRPERLKALRSK
ncbi:MAG: hypothetical protein ACF8OB_17955 [Phycisphaeraceae bacterium JB051]